MRTRFALFSIGLLLAGCQRLPSGRYVSEADKPRMIEIVDSSTLRADWIKDGETATLVYTYTCTGSHVSVFDGEQNVANLYFDAERDELRINPLAFKKKKK